MSLQLQTSDGVSLEAEWSDAAGGDAAAVAVLCHPHPQYGGTMRSIVISALFDSLPARGIACMRFNFRGVEGSAGSHGEGRDEPLDVVAAIDAASARIVRSGAGVPLVVVGWSFGADMALTVSDARIAAWVAIAPPLRFRPASDYDAVGRDPRPKLLELAAHDEFRAPDEIVDAIAGWTNTRVETIPGASHFFVGRTDRVVDLTADFVRSLF